MVGFKNDHLRKNLTQNGEPQNIQLGNAEEEEEWTSPIQRSSPNDTLKNRLITV